MQFNARNGVQSRVIVQISLSGSCPWSVSSFVCSNSQLSPKDVNQNSLMLWTYIFTTITNTTISHVCAFITMRFLPINVVRQPTTHSWLLCCSRQVKPLIGGASCKPCQIFPEELIALHSICFTKTHNSIARP